MIYLMYGTDTIFLAQKESVLVHFPAVFAFSNLHTSIICVLWKFILFCHNNYIYKCLHI